MHSQSNYSDTIRARETDPQFNRVHTTGADDPRVHEVNNFVEECRLPASGVLTVSSRNKMPSLKHICVDLRVYSEFIPYETSSNNTIKHKLHTEARLVTNKSEE
jgi:hypothetical protein